MNKLQNAFENEKKVVLSTAWIFVMFNYLYCDIMAVMDSKILKQFIEGRIGNMEMTQEFFLGAAVLMEIPIAMVFLSRVLQYKSNRILNIIAGAFMTIVQISSLFVGSSPTVYYIFFSFIEISCTIFIATYSVKWRNNNFREQLYAK